MKTPGMKHQNRYIIFSKLSDIFFKKHGIFPGGFCTPGIFFAGRLMKNTVPFLIFVLTILSSCAESPVQLPSGPGSAVVDSLVYSRQDFDSLTVRYNSSSSSSSIYNYIGGYRDADCKSILLFNNFTSIVNRELDVDSIVLNDAYFILKEHQTWGDVNNFIFKMSLIPDTEDFYWADTTDFDTYWQTLSGQLTDAGQIVYSPDSIKVLLSNDIVLKWWKPSDQENNNGFVLDYDPANPDGIIGYYSSNFSTVMDRPRLELNCTVYDTSGAKEETFIIYAGRDFTYSELREQENKPDFFISQGAIRRAFITSSQLLTEIQGVSLNYARLSLTIDPLTSYFDEDSLTVYVGLFTSDNWDSKNFKFSTYQNSGKIKVSDTELNIPITEVLMNMQDNAETAVSGLYIRMNNELYGFNQVSFKPELTELKIIKTDF